MNWHVGVRHMAWIFLEFLFFQKIFEYILFRFDIRVKSLYLTVWASMIHMCLCVKHWFSF